MISRIASYVSALDGLVFLLTLVAGLGMLGYVGISWLLHLAISGQYFSVAVVAALVCAIVAAALSRIPIAQIVVLSGAAVCGVSILFGYGSVLLP